MSSFLKFFGILGLAYALSAAAYVLICNTCRSHFPSEFNNCLHDWQLEIKKRSANRRMILFACCFLIFTMIVSGGCAIKFDS